MNKIRFLLLIGSQILAGVLSAQSPNIILFLADDQGWTGTSVLMDKNRPDSKSDYYQTPALERLAEQGMRFSQAYSPSSELLVHSHEYPNR
jgi:hypothetical protein